jgi:hypothetical protein
VKSVNQAVASDIIIAHGPHAPDSRREDQGATPRDDDRVLLALHRHRFYTASSGSNSGSPPIACETTFAVVVRWLCSDRAARSASWSMHACRIT